VADLRTIAQTVLCIVLGPWRQPRRRPVDPDPSREALR
jgi:hypothetical protein